MKYMKHACMQNPLRVSAPLTRFFHRIQLQSSYGVIEIWIQLVKRYYLGKLRRELIYQSHVQSDFALALTLLFMCCLHLDIIHWSYSEMWRARFWINCGFSKMGKENKIQGRFSKGNKNIKDILFIRGDSRWNQIFKLYIEVNI